MTNKYRRIYERECGPIPKDEHGRSYHIHHIDGDRNNNNPDNLLAISLQEHYDIHYRQKDWTACHRLSILLDMDPSVTSELIRKAHAGKPKSTEHRQRISEALKNYDRTEEHSKAISVGRKNMVKHTCPVCGKSMDKSNYVKYKHGEACKQMEITD